MKKLDRREYADISGIIEFNDYHGTHYRGWSQFYLEVGVDWLGVDISNDEDYELYEKWHLVVNTPLYKALNEKD